MKNDSLAMKMLHFQRVYNLGVCIEMFEMIHLDEQK